MTLTRPSLEQYPAYREEAGKLAQVQRDLEEAQSRKTQGAEMHISTAQRLEEAEALELLGQPAGADAIRGELLELESEMAGIDRRVAVLQKAETMQRRSVTAAREVYERETQALFDGELRAKGQAFIDAMGAAAEALAQLAEVEDAYDQARVAKPYSLSFQWSDLAFGYYGRDIELRDGKIMRGQFNATKFYSWLVWARGLGYQTPEPIRHGVPVHAAGACADADARDFAGAAVQREQRRTTPLIDSLRGIAQRAIGMASSRFQHFHE